MAGRGVDLKNEEEVREYLENLGIEYRFGCYHEKNPKCELCNCCFSSVWPLTVLPVARCLERSGIESVLKITRIFQSCHLQVLTLDLLK